MYFLRWRTPKPRPRSATRPTRTVPITTASTVPVSVNIVLIAPVVDAIVHIVSQVSVNVVVVVSFRRH